MARRKQSDNSERRTEFVGFQVTPAERAEIDERAKAGGVSVSEYARAAALNYQLEVRDQLKPHALFELSAIGNNLNQIARQANMTDEIDAEELKAALFNWRKVAEKMTE